MSSTESSLPRGRIRRAVPLAGFTARAAGGRVVAGLRERAGDAGAVDRFHERTAERYTQLLGHSKGVLMKAGQIFSMVDNGSIGAGELSPYQKALTRLQADAPPMDPRLAKEVLQADLGRTVEELFADFSDEPMAAASIGQVHRAVLHDGRDVAVKIQYPGVAEAIQDDLANTELLATFYRFAAVTSRATTPDLRSATSEIAARISEEIDYRHEAANIAAFSDLYRNHPFIVIPEVIHHASGDRVLTMSYLDGMDWAAAQDADQDVKNTWAEAILRFATGSYRHGNLLHVDPHSGNFRFFPDGRVGFLDYGCVKVLPESVRRNLVALLRAAMEGRRSELRDLMVDIGMFKGDSTITADEAYAWYAEVLHEVLAPQPFTYTPDAAQRAIRAQIDARSPDHVVRRMAIPQDLVFATRVTLCVNSICAGLNATVHARSMVDDMDGLSDPISHLGEQHCTWVRESGLPFGLESR